MYTFVCTACGAHNTVSKSWPFTACQACGVEPSEDQAVPETIQLPADGLPLDCISYRCACGTDVFGAELIRIANGKPQRVCMTCVMKP